VNLLRSAFAGAHRWLEGTVDNVSNDVANFVPPGKTATAGAHYLHHAAGEDFFVSRFRGGAPLLAGEWSGRIGSAEPPPFGDWGAWGRSAQIDMPAARQYAQAVWQNTDGYLASLSDQDLEQPASLTDLGFPEMTLGAFLSGLLLIDAGAHCGEISAIKGMQGLRGYPF
jgi:hypothetical protein